jgi:hypothetical protein
MQLLQAVALHRNFFHNLVVRFEKNDWDETDPVFIAAKEAAEAAQRTVVAICEAKYDPPDPPPPKLPKFKTGYSGP